jgi:hypothetical protein
MDEGDGMTKAPRATAAFDGLIGALAEIRDGYVQDDARGFDEAEALEGYRYAIQMVSQVSELLIEGDRERPRFSLIVSPARKFLGDNPDAIYHQAIIRDDRAYRIHGRRTGQAYISFTVHGVDPTGGFGGPVLADVNDDAIDFGPDGSFTLILGPDAPAADTPGTWIRLDPGARVVIVRNYFAFERSAQTDPSVFVDIAIEPLEPVAPAPPITDAELADRLEQATAMLKANTLGLRVFGTPSPVSFVSNEPNSVGTPFSFRATGEAVAGAVDIFYSTGSFDLGPDDALVMEGTIPPSRFTNVMLWNVHMQTLEYCTHRISLNHEQIALEPDGSYRIVVSARDPGVANWLDTCGHRRGTIFWRFLLPETDPETPRCSVVPVDSVRA